MGDKVADNKVDFYSIDHKKISAANIFLFLIPEGGPSQAGLLELGIAHGYGECEREHNPEVISGKKPNKLFVGYYPSGDNTTLNPMLKRIVVMIENKEKDLLSMLDAFKMTLTMLLGKKTPWSFK